MTFKLIHFKMSLTLMSNGFIIIKFNTFWFLFPNIQVPSYQNNCVYKINEFKKGKFFCLLLKYCSTKGRCITLVTSSTSLFVTAEFFFSEAVLYVCSESLRNFLYVMDFIVIEVKIVTCSFKSFAKNSLPGGSFPCAWGKGRNSHQSTGCYCLSSILAVTLFL